MKRPQRFKTGLATLLLGLSLSVAALAESPRIAFVNTPQVLEQAPQAGAVRETLQSEFSTRDAELVAEQKELKEMEERMGRESLTMSQEQQRKLEREILSRKRELKRSRDDFAEDFNIRRNEELQKMQRQIAASIVAMAEEDGYDLILENGVIYASEKVDITERVIERLKRDFAKGNSD
ncbi:MAG: OmpH family outer membrane protein [Pseudomonadota bacterium]